MKLFLDMMRTAASHRPKRSMWVALSAILATLLPSFAGASEGNVVLTFSGSDKIYLYISLALGAVALIFAFLLTKEVLKQSPGSDRMQEVGKAIKEGALAYLRKQVGTMSIFVVILAIGLFFLKQNEFQSTPLAMWVAISFVGGVFASYIAGYTGMLMAVEGNMRTANSALTSYSKTLRVAFRSGAVAGMVTVGMGLIGASLIFMLAQGDAMKLLVGFGFGGSLAALFMRVGGGIFTKAADVGADLVGKVEAGIPEDDPRNPATIADNVGDNVGDCAGMAADVFESYEVTLVAAIILGAATAAIFDQSTWMKLILFALMARGVGIVASIAGIYMVRGSDDLDSDPLGHIRKGFWSSAFIAAAGTIALAFFLMGGKGSPIMTTQVSPLEAVRREKFPEIKKIRDAILKANPNAGEMPPQLMTDPGIKAMGLDKPEYQMVISEAINFKPEKAAPLEDMSGYHKVDFDNKKEPVSNYITARFDEKTNKLKAARVGDDDGLKGQQILIEKLRITQQQPPPVKGQPATPPQVTERYFGPIIKSDLEAQIKKAPVKVEELSQDTIPVSLYANDAGDVAFVMDRPAGVNPLILPASVGGMPFFKDTKANVDGMFNRTSPPGAQMPRPITNVTMGIADHVQVAWYLFALAILFGIVMAFAIELLTDYYVSTHKRPVQEIAGVSTAGPAPMIIQGFALGAESSVFSVFSIVIALIMPLVFFPPSSFNGSYLLSFYGIALVGLGLLTTTGFILAMDTFGPISDNAQGVFEMSGAGHESAEGSKAVQRLDAAGNTTKALTKGFAIATAVVAAVALFHSYLQDAHLTLNGIRLEIPEIFLGLLIGGAAPYLFAAFSINAVGRASFQLITEVRRQFREDAGIMAGTSKPNYGRCVAIVTEAAQKELLGPGILAIALPVAVAFGFSIGKKHVMIGGGEYNLVGAQALGGFLAGAILSGQLMAVLLANSGGMWDNAKKLIEDGLYGGKGTDAHKAGVVCDTVGDPFKDTAGPAMNPLIKVMNLVALLLAAIVIKPWSDPILMTITGCAILALAFSVWWSKRASFSSALNAATESATHTPLASGHAEENIPAAPAKATRRITVEDESDAANEQTE